MRNTWVRRIRISYWVRSLGRIKNQMRRIVHLIGPGAWCWPHHIRSLDDFLLLSL
jgi:hypothetical protein